MKFSASSKVRKLLSGAFLSRAGAQAHNLAAPVNQLSPRILAYIFEFASSEIRDTSMKWIALSHTCQLWRSIALDHEALWTDISFLNPRWTEVMLARSGSTLPITVCLKDSDHRTDAWTETFHKLEHPPIDRIRSLIVGGWFGRMAIHKCYPQTLLEAGMIHPPSHTWLGQNFHALENLEIEGKMSFSGEPCVGELCKALVRSAPPLHRIRFVDIRYEKVDEKWDFLPKLGANLKSLTLWWTLSDGLTGLSGVRVSPSISELVGYLKAMPRLEYLAVSSIHPGRTDEDRSIPTVTLENLKTIITWDYVSTQTLLFDAMRIPNAQRIDIRVYGAMRSTVPIVQLLASVRRAWKGNAKDSVFTRLGTGFKQIGPAKDRYYKLWVKVYDDAAGCATVILKCIGPDISISAVEQTFQHRLGLTEDQTDKCVRWSPSEHRARLGHLEALQEAAPLA
ncbi:hypothetical protein DFP72DRAFT_1094508 [Ephemerocybe angulata]|uniref:F-box domain-containing protein n=1 Tax=Ephemerocybe angulata TaxID=980116 RepID=A0A8H6MA29_9AGAR|nr:hypothetical protein DFP72DRAFT_1094508 [Tulosesus angulatus]